MMKLITFAIPSYNSEDYMSKCIDSLLVGGEDVEILIVNDGSKDRTADIALEYEKQYPSICKAINKENGGHGSAVNKGIELASGLYFKVVDSDDWYDEESYKVMLETMHRFVDRGVEPDLFISNYVYDNVEEGLKPIRFSNVFKEDTLMGWDEIGRFLPSQNLLMHTLIYKTSVLRESGVKLPEHTFYVDSIFAYVPLPYVKTLVYENLDLYHYFIGRSDQSVNTKIMCSRIDQQISVTKIMMNVDLNDVRTISKKLERYMFQYLAAMMVVCCIHLYLIDDEEALGKVEELWTYVKQKDKKLYRRLRTRSSAILAHPHTYLGKKGFVTIYQVGKKLFKFQ